MVAAKNNSSASSNYRIRKPTTQRGKRILEDRSPKLVENAKTTLFVKGGRTSEVVTNCMKNMFQLKKPFGVFLKRHNEFHPFEDDTPFEKFGQKFDASQFVFGSHSKKRPNNIVIGRMHDFHVLDLVEFGIENFRQIQDFPALKPAVGIKPCLIFAGEGFQEDATLVRIKSLFTDFFRGEVVENIRLQGIESVLCFTAAKDRILIRSYRINLKKSGSRTPRVELEEVGPRCDVVVRRQRLASDDFFKTASKQPTANKPKSVKNVSHDPFGSKLARIHLGKQPLSGLQTRKMKGLKRLNNRGAAPFKDDR